MRTAFVTPRRSRGERWLSCNARSSRNASPLFRTISRHTHHQKVLSTADISGVTVLRKFAKREADGSSIRTETARKWIFGMPQADVCLRAQQQRGNGCVELHGRTDYERYNRRH